MCIENGITKATHFFHFNVIVLAFLTLTLLACDGGSDSPPTVSTAPPPLVPPSIVNTQSDKTTIIIDWPLQPSVSLYHLYWSTTSGAGKNGIKVIVPANEARFVHQFLEDGTSIKLGIQYYYSIIAVRDNVESEVSIEVSAQLKIKALPATPINLVATPQNSSITVTWGSITGITNYTVYWSTTSGTSISGTKKIIPSTQAFFKHQFLADGSTPLASGTNYFYVVTAQDVNGESFASVEVTTKLTEVAVSLPQPPIGIVVTPQNSLIQLQWDSDPTVNNYNAYWSTTAGAGLTGIKVPLAAGVSIYRHEFIDDKQSGLSTGVNYYYVITSVKNNIESLPSNEIIAQLKNKPWLMPLLNSIIGN